VVVFGGKNRIHVWSCLTGKFRIPAWLFGGKIRIPLWSYLVGKIASLRGRIWREKFESLRGHVWQKKLHPCVVTFGENLHPCVVVVDGQIRIFA
jgi:hypothetical protein